MFLNKMVVRTYVTFGKIIPRDLIQRLMVEKTRQCPTANLKSEVIKSDDFKAEMYRLEKSFVVHPSEDMAKFPSLSDWKEPKLELDNTQFYYD